MPGASGAPAAAPSASAAGDEAAPDGEGEPPIRPRVPSVASKKWRRCRGGGAKKRKRISHARPRASGLAWPAPDPSSRAILFRISKIIQKVTNGIAGNVDGFDGSVNATGAACILRSLRAKGRIFVDLGCGYGWMMAAAFGMGAVASVGIELPVNIGQMCIYEGVIKKMQEEKAGFTCSFQQKHEFIHLDINEVFAVTIVLRLIVLHSLLVVVFCIGQLPAMPCGSQCACAFWNGMGRKTQCAILRLCARCPTLEDIAVFRDPKNWTGYTEGAPFQTWIHSSGRFFIDEWVGSLE